MRLHPVRYLIDVDKITDELKEALVNEPECGYASRFLDRVGLGDGRFARLELVLIVEKEDDYD